MESCFQTNSSMLAEVNKLTAEYANQLATASNLERLINDATKLRERILESRPDLHAAAQVTLQGSAGHFHLLLGLDFPSTCKVDTHKTNTRLNTIRLRKLEKTYLPLLSKPLASIWGTLSKSQKYTALCTMDMEQK